MKHEQGSASRRGFIKAVGASVAVASAPMILRADDKAADKAPVIGEGAHKYEAIHGWAKVPENIKLGNTHMVQEDAQGRILIHHQGGSGESVCVFDADGKFIKAWGKRGDQPGEFNLPHTIVIDSRGRVLVGDRSNNRIQIFDQDGTFIDQWSEFGTPSGMYVTPDDTLYVVDYNVRKGVFVGSAKDGSVRYKLDDAVAEGVAVDKDGNIYVGETVPGTTLTGQPGGHIVRKLERVK